MPATPGERLRFRQLSKEQIKYERTWQPLIESVINAQVKEFTDALISHGKEYALQHIDELIAPGPMYDVLRRLYRSVGTMAADSQYRYFQITYGAELRQQKSFGFNKLWASIMESLFSRIGADKVVKISDTERQRLKRELELASQDPNISNKELAKRLQGAEIGKARSAVIARTETAIAASEGGEAAAVRTGVLMEKVWLSAQDIRTRHLPEDSSDHRVMNGVAVRMDEKFLVPSKRGLDPMTRPHDPDGYADQVIMCRCKAIYRAVRDAAGRFLRIPIPA